MLRAPAPVKTAPRGDAVGPREVMGAAGFAAGRDAGRDASRRQSREVSALAHSAHRGGSRKGSHKSSPQESPLSTPLLKPYTRAFTIYAGSHSERGKHADHTKPGAGEESPGTWEFSMY